MSDDYIEVKLCVPKDHVFLGYQSDIDLLRYLQHQFRTSPDIDKPDSPFKKFVDFIENYIQRCKARQHVLCLFSDEPFRIEDLPNTDILTQEDMEIDLDED